MTNLTHTSSAKKATTHKRSPYIGVTKDGVKILRPTGRVDNISLEGARKAVAAVRAQKEAKADHK
jgi:DNA-binding Xre family transcriptional regulator